MFYSFGRPTVMTNWLVNGLPPYPRQGLFLPKLVYLTKERRLLPFKDLFGPLWSARCYGSFELESHETHLVENTAEEINEAVREMLARLTTGDQMSAEERSLQNRLASLVTNDSPQGLAKIGASFLQRYQELL